MKCKKCGEKVKFEEERDKKVHIKCSKCDNELEYHEEDLLNTLIDRIDSDFIKLVHIYSSYYMKIYMII